MKKILTALALISFFSHSYAQRQLELKPKVGTVVRGAMSIDMEMNMFGKEMTNKSNYHITYKIDQIDDNGDVTVTHQIDSITIQVHADGQDMQISSNNPSSYEGNAQFASLMSGVGKSFISRFDKYGKLLTDAEGTFGDNVATLFIEYLPLDKKNSWELETEKEINGMKVKLTSEYTWKKEEANKIYLDCKSKSTIMGMKITAPSEVIIDAPSGLVLSNIGSSQNNMMGVKMKTNVTYIATIE